MDLGTIKKKLEAKQYGNAEEFAEDIRLVCDNCFKYNPTTDIIHQHGRALLQAFNKRWVNLPVDRKVIRVMTNPDIATETVESGAPGRKAINNHEICQITPNEDKGVSGSSCTTGRDLQRNRTSRGTFQPIISANRSSVPAGQHNGSQSICDRISRQ
ncbi:unnamed protein product [Cylicostephanus goldi]|uniref:Bromo domain-containing protein n=1 Tax=Cylicostephanus goldi TaxID=71465 RepID=A0A3P6TAQ2_CYLGO|nr:unnamed protein product [Cylicostephanus goldi]